jgi:hypothetical protein
MDVPHFPLPYQIACIVLTALFLWAFVVARQPRNWRRWFQAMFSRADRFSINRNKVLDEKITKYGIIVAMVILVLDAAVFVTGMTHRTRNESKSVPVDEWHGTQETKKFNGTLPQP